MITKLTYTSPLGSSYEIPHGRIQRIEGISNAPYRESSSLLAGIRGGQFNQSLLDVRSITIDWEIIKDTLANYLLERDSIFAAFNPEECVDGAQGTLLIEINSATVYRIPCVPNSTPKVPERAMLIPSARAQVQLIANEPEILSNTLHQSSNISPTRQGGFTFDVIFDIIFEPTSSGSINISNAGNIKTYPIVYLVDALTNPLIRNATTGEYMQLNYSSSPNDVIAIDMKQRIVTLNDVTNLLTYVTSGSEFWGLKPGTNQIILSTGLSSDTGYFYLTHRDAWNSK